MSDRSGLARRNFLRLSSIAGASMLSGVGSATPGRDPGAKTNEWVVGVSTGDDSPGRILSDQLSSQSAVVYENDRMGYACVTTPADRSSKRSLLETLSTAIESPGPVKYVEQNCTYCAQYLPNDPHFEEQYAATTIGAPAAWDETLGSNDVTIAVIDQGMQYDHPDLSQNVADDPGWDFITNSPDPYPDDLDAEPHGTHVAGIAGARTDNNNGVTGVGNFRLLSARVLDKAGRGSVTDIADGIEWAVDRGADVINLSLGGGRYSQTMQNAVRYASAHDVLVVVAAGNSSDGKSMYPASYDECVAVSALDPDGTLSSFSNYGPAIELAAPGRNVVSTWPGDGYRPASGTSMATPVVAGVAGLALSKWDLTSEQLRRQLKRTAVDIGLSELEQGAGRIDAAGAVHARPRAGVETAMAETPPDSSSLKNRVSGRLTAFDDTEHFSYSWGTDSPETISVTLLGPESADFDLYVNEGRTEIPGTDEYDYAGRTSSSHERVTIENPTASVPLQVTVHAYHGSGSFSLGFEESR
ncbi:S8 family peptidase [Halocatena halophila]|uniref:S8 family peptidase n=1 Tax=Halocatena halophila TaxID=2814576 RepID=UPI002ED11E34